MSEYLFPEDDPAFSRDRQAWREGWDRFGFPGWAVKDGVPDSLLWAESETQRRVVRVTWDPEMEQGVYSYYTDIWSKRTPEARDMLVLIVPPGSEVPGWEPVRAVIEQWVLHGKIKGRLQVYCVGSE